MDNDRKLNMDNVYHPENFDKNTPLLPNKPQDEFLIDDDVTLITMDNLKKLNQWEKEEKNKQK